MPICRSGEIGNLIKELPMFSKIAVVLLFFVYVGVIALSINEEKNRP